MVKDLKVPKEKFLKFIEGTGLYSVKFDSGRFEVIYSSHVMDERLGEGSYIVLTGRVEGDSLVFEKAFIQEGGERREVDLDIFSSWIDVIESSG